MKEKSIRELIKETLEEQKIRQELINLKLQEKVLKLRIRTFYLTLVISIAVAIFMGLRAISVLF